MRTKLRLLAGPTAGMRIHRLVWNTPIIVRIAIVEGDFRINKLILRLEGKLYIIPIFCTGDITCS